MDKRPYLIALVLLLLVAGSAWLAMHSKTDSRANGGSAPDYFIEGLSASTYDPTGQLSRILRTERLTHSPADEGTTLTAPRITLYDGDNPPWEIQAGAGWVSEDGDLVLLQEGVTIVRAAGAGTAPVQITTEELRIQPDSHYLETDREVRLTSHNNRVEATGLQAWLNKPIRIKLLADARGHYEVH